MAEEALPAAGPAAEGGEGATGVKAPPTTSHAAAESGGGGLPQFRMEYWGGQIVWLLVLFALLYVLLSRVFIPRLRRVLDQRETAINEAIEGARRVREESEAQARGVEADLAEARANAQRTAAEAKARAAAEAQARQAAQEAELNSRLSEAEARIRQGRDQAMGSVRQVAAETTAAIVEKLTGQAAAPADIESALAAASPRTA